MTEKRKPLYVKSLNNEYMCCTAVVWLVYSSIEGAFEPIFGGLNEFAYLIYPSSTMCTSGWCGIFLAIIVERWIVLWLSGMLVVLNSSKTASVNFLHNFRINCEFIISKKGMYWNKTILRIKGQSSLMNKSFHLMFFKTKGWVIFC